jgi:hypothetical protein
MERSGTGCQSRGLQASGGGFTISEFAAQPPFSANFQTPNACRPTPFLCGYQ